MIVGEVRRTCRVGKGGFLERGEAGGARVVRRGLRGSGCGSVLVDEPVTGGGAPHRLVEFDHGRVAFVGVCALAETAMGPMGVVVRHELLEEPTQLPLVPDQGPIE